MLTEWEVKRASVYLCILYCGLKASDILKKKVKQTAMAAREETSSL